MSHIYKGHNYYFFHTPFKVACSMHHGGNLCLCVHEVLVPKVCSGDNVAGVRMVIHSAKKTRLACYYVILHQGVGGSRSPASESTTFL